MEKRSTDKKEIIIRILVLLGGVALTVTSFCMYYLAKPQNAAVLIVLCAIDFLYSFFSTCVFCKINHENKWALKGLALSTIYTVGFIAVAVLFMVFNSSGHAFLKNDFLTIVLYAFFTVPSGFIVLVLLLLLLSGG